MDNVDTVSVFSHALNTLRTSSLRLNGEPHFHHLADPPGKALLQAYLQNLTPRKIVFYAEIPSADQHPTGEAWILKILLQQWGDLDWNKREAAYKKEHRLKELLKRETELVVIADIHHLGNNAQASQQFEILLSLFQTGRMMPLLIVGEPSQMRQLLASNERFVWRFPPLYWE